MYKRDAIQIIGFQKASNFIKLPIPSGPQRSRPDPLRSLHCKDMPRSVSKESGSFIAALFC